MQTSKDEIETADLPENSHSEMSSGLSPLDIVEQKTALQT